MAERQFGPYRLVRQIAVGGMAEIHLAKTKGIAGFEKYVALKMIHPNFAEDEQFIEMLVDEAKIAVQLTHGNIAQTFDLGRVGETYYITMEFVDGADLYKVLRRGSEMELDVPLDVCAFIGKEVGAALDYAHRKRDHSGKSLGIVHRDVSPQNVLVSHAGEVKLVDFGIAKATMKARQTAVGVIKGKYYYMSPEQAWGDPLDHRSDIFSSGIVLYEMVCGQMLYLEEDLHKLLDMARKAEIAPPSRLRKGVPPQLERIIMHALEKEPSARYQSAADMASDLERFLHAYSPVFTASKVAAMLRQVLGEPVAEPDYVVEMHGGVNATMSLDIEQLAHDKEEIRDENSVIFRLSDLGTKPPIAPAPAAPKPPPPAPVSGSVTARPAVVPPRGALVPTKIPAIPRGNKAPTLPPPMAASAATAIAPAVINTPSPIASPSAGTSPAVAPVPRPTAKPRQADEETREINHAQAPAARAALWAGASDMSTESIDDDLENIGERTMITAAPGMTGGGGPTGGFMSDDGGDDDLENIGERTLITSMPTDPGTDTNVAAAAASGGHDDDTGQAMAASDGGADGFEEGPTTARDFTAPPKRVVTAKRAAAPPPPALSAKIQTPAVSELRKPRASRRTPPGGVPAQPNVLQAIVNRAGSEPMPAPPRPTTNPGTAPPSVRANAGSMTMNVPTPTRNTASPTMPPDAHFTADLDSAPTLAPGLPSPASSLNGIPSGPLSQSMQAMPSMPSGPLSQSMYSYQEPSGPQTALAPAQQPQQMYPGQAPQYSQQGQPHQPQQYTPQPGYPHGQPYQTPPQGFPPQQYQQPYQQSPQAHDATGMPLGLSTPPPGYPMQSMPGVPPHLQPYAQQGYGQQPQQMSQQGYPQLSPAQMYPYHPYAQPAPMPPTLTGQLRAFEVDEMPSQYKLNNGPRWALLGIAGVFAISAAATVTYFVIRSTRETAPTTATVRVSSVPPGAAVYFDGQRLTDKTPLTLDGVPVGTHHEVRVELAKHKTYTDSIDIPKDGHELPFTAQLDPITGRLDIDTTPANAEIYINNELRGRTPKSLSGIDMDSVTKLELRLKDYQPIIQPLTWPDNGTIDIKAKFER